MGGQLAGLVGKLLKAEGITLDRVTGEISRGCSAHEKRPREMFTVYTTRQFSAGSSLTFVRIDMEQRERAKCARSGRHTHEQRKFRTNDADGHRRLLRQRRN